MNMVNDKPKKIIPPPPCLELLRNLRAKILFTEHRRILIQDVRPQFPQGGDPRGVQGSGQAKDYAQTEKGNTQYIILPPEVLR